MDQILLPFLVLAGACAVACFALLMVLYLHHEQQARRRAGQSTSGLSELGMLFGTMRDIMRQQQVLASDFRRELDKQREEVRQMLTESLSRHERLFEQEQRLVQELEASRAGLDSLRENLGQAREASVVESAESAPPPVREPAHETPGMGSDLEGYPLFEDDSLESTGITSAPYTSWSDPGNELAAPEGEEQEPSRVAPGDAAAAREAFCALLDLDPGAAGDLAPSRDPEALQGHSDATRRKVVDYREAGMEVADIARELGISKSEVRLMLSLARLHQEH